MICKLLPTSITRATVPKDEGTPAAANPANPSHSSLELMPANHILVNNAEDLQQA